MTSRALWFNTILIAAVTVLAGGCQGPGKSKDLAAIRLHLEVNPDGTERSHPVPIGRSTPFMVNVEKIPFLTEYQLKEAMLVDTNDGFALKLEFDKPGTWLLEQYTAANQGRQVAIFAQWEEQLRWLAAPQIEKRITNGVLVFTPDATRDESERLVIGLNKSVKEIGRGRF